MDVFLESGYCTSSQPKQDPRPIILSIRHTWIPKMIGWELINIKKYVSRKLICNLVYFVTAQPIQEYGLLCPGQEIGIGEVENRMIR
jgi:hypothetical protein